MSVHRNNIIEGKKIANAGNDKIFARKKRNTINSSLTYSADRVISKTSCKHFIHLTNVPCFLYIHGSTDGFGQVIRSREKCVDEQ